jgi:spore maturation protein CgeB
MAIGPDRDSQWVRTLVETGFDVQSFPVDGLLRYDPGIIGRFERRFHIGKPIKQIEKQLLYQVEISRPDWVHFRLPLVFDKTTIQKIKEKTSVVSAYCNDDPFSPLRVKGLYRLYKEAIPVYDAHFTYRSRNIHDFLKAGAKYVAHTPPVYVPWRHYPPEWKNSERDKYLSDAAFIGHWEKDNRLDCIDSLLRAGFRVNLRGGNWDRNCKRRPSEKMIPVKTAFGEEYNKLYEAASAGLCFYSKINRDELTERTFEIPAVGGVLVCERTDEVRQHFEDKKEAFFFSDSAELVQIVDYLKKDKTLRDTVAKAGRLRLSNGRHSIKDRLVDIVNLLIQWNFLSIEKIPVAICKKIIKKNGSADILMGSRLR